MKRVKIYAAVIISMMFFFSCKKDKYVKPPFSAVGYWNGATNGGTGFAILNRADGSCRIYQLVNGTDTAHAILKLDGIYHVEDDDYTAHCENSEVAAELLTLYTTENSIRGSITMTMNQSVFDAILFNVLREQ